MGEGFAARRRERAGSQRAVVLIGFGDGHKAFLLQGADVRGEIAIRHVQQVAQLGEGEFGRGGQRGHDGQPPFLVDHTVELEK